MTTIDRDRLKRRARSGYTVLLRPDEVIALLDALTRAEAQSETRRQQTVYWQERAEGFEVAEEQLLLRNRNLLDAHREAEARIQAVRDVLAHHPYGGPDQEDAVRRALVGNGG